MVWPFWVHVSPVAKATPTWGTSKTGGSATSAHSGEVAITPIAAHRTTRIKSMQKSPFAGPRPAQDTLISEDAGTGGVGDEAEFTGAHCTFVQLAAAALMFF